ncbi:MAG: hypothetical protein JWO30_4316 [Fibrobacteres bacterium]|nr:hypothetical protein [Fibrobacterota bacterium]
MNYLKSCLIVTLSIASLAAAHLEQGSLSIHGGETFTVGQIVKVTLVQTVGHNNGKYDFYFSKNNGTAWTEIIGNFQGPKEDGATVTYNWTVPNSVTAQGMFRACQLAGGECTDPIYILKSGAFTVVAAGTGIGAVGTASATAPSMTYSPETRSLETSFELSSAEKVTLQVFDARGQVLATLLDGSQEAGVHHLSLFSNALDAASGHLMFKLTVGGETYTRLFNTLR